MQPATISLVMMLPFSFLTFSIDMFDFLSKFTFRSPKAGVAIKKMPAQDVHEAARLQLAETQKNQIEQARAMSMAKIEQLSADEPALITFLLTCDFADGRYKAAQFVQSQAGLEQVRAAMLNSDKRVAKLMQSRLDLIAQARRQEQLAQLCVERARNLLDQAHLLSNQVSDLDKQQAAVGTFPATWATQFEQLRQQLDAKMLAQNALQRRVLDILAQLSSDDGAMDGTYGDRLSLWQHEFDECLSLPQAASLPKNILNECEGKLSERQQRWQVVRKNLEKHDKDEVQQTPQSAETESSKSLAPDTVASEAAESVPQVALAAASETKENAAGKAIPVLSKLQIIAAIQGMEEALVQGSVQAARKFDRELRAVDIRSAGLSAEHKSALIQARSELSYLQGYAKWGGDVSRDELIKTVEDLPALSLTPTEVAKKIAALRERWKEMEANSGAANKELWERFDAACKIAYAPAALYFQEQAELRKVNLSTAETTLNDVRTKVADLLQAPPDWKAIANFCSVSQQNWKKLGHVDRKHKARLDAEFEASLELLQQPLQQRRNEDMVARAALIKDVEALDPLQKNVAEKLRLLQERWKSHATSVPLRRKDEQALWDKFRAACDHLFAQRKLASGEADVQRKENLAIKLDLLDKLEQALASVDLKIPVLLQQTSTTWRLTGPVPRAEETKLEQRYQNAVQELQNLDQTRLEQQSQIARKNCIRQLAGCQQLEQILIQETRDENDLAQIAQISEELTQLGTLPAKLRTILNARFQAAMAALDNTTDAYRLLLKKNAAESDSRLLQLEILFGINSPPELSRERMQMQVEVLQSSLKRGGSEQSGQQTLLDFLALPTILDAVKSQRLEAVLVASDLF